MARTAGLLRTPTSPDVSDHAAWAYASDAQRAQAASEWIATGLRAGQRGLYVAEGTHDVLASELAGIDGATEALQSGAVVVMSSTDIYDLSQPIDPVSQLALYAGAVEQAKVDGYNGIRVAADITPLVADPARRETHTRWEQFADRWIVDNPLSPLCLYDTRRIDDIDPIVCAHPLQGPRQPAFALYADGPTSAALLGEVDACIAPTFIKTLKGVPTTDGVIDLTGLTFIDGRAAWALHDEVARRRETGQDLVLVGAPPLVRRIWRICGFDASMLAGA